MSGDPIEDVIVHLIRAMRSAFNPLAATPPRGGGTDVVRFFAGDSVPLAAWNAHSSECDCGEPFAWVRLIQRYRTDPNSFPAPDIRARSKGCGKLRAAEIEIGIARCAVTDPDVDWKAYENEAMVNLDDSRRLDAAACRALNCAVNDDDAIKTSIGPVVTNGPQGAVIAVVGTVWVMLPD